ncbi:hypothetical protein RhiirA1_399491 [Rhizophagus irregularis]|uniref:MULE transposase domain-containing protein n=1 Tax=Rhizophagus irregularis TaxID=588596 RepID=A0A2N0R9S3_9GLOM|nr:hypothetical protein RhiirA1_399491 [Rhizophagus irregularis]
MQYEEHGWFVEARLEGGDNYLTAVVSDETKETYQWISEYLLHATNGLAPRVLFTDVDTRSDEKDSKVKFAEDDYESKLSNLCSLFSYLDHAVIHEVWSVTTIEQNKEHFVNLSRKAKYNEGFGYAKRAIGLSLELRCENEINEILQSWIRKKEIEIRDRQLGCIIESKKNLPNISNPHQTCIKGALKKHVKNTLENTTIKYSNNKNRQDIKKLNDKHHEKSIKELNKQPRNELQREISTHQTRYICSYCKGSGHNARSCELKKKVLGQELDKQIFLI